MTDIDIVLNQRAVEHKIDSWIPIEQEVWNRLYHVIRGKSDHVTYFQNKS
jgi:hypothetical protein